MTIGHLPCSSWLSGTMFHPDQICARRNQKKHAWNSDCCSATPVSQLRSELQYVLGWSSIYETWIFVLISGVQQMWGLFNIIGRYPNNLFISTSNMGYIPTLPIKRLNHAEHDNQPGVQNFETKLKTMFHQRFHRCSPLVPIGSSFDSSTGGPQRNHDPEKARAFPRLMARMAGMSNCGSSKQWGDTPWLWVKNDLKPSRASK